MTTETTHTFCRLCEVMCGLVVETTDGAITKVRPDTDHPVSQGFACNKGLLTKDIHLDPARLDHPMRRTGDGWKQVSWDDAAGDIATRLRDVIDAHGPESVAVYIGNPAAFNPLAGPAAAMFLLSLGSGNVFSAGTQDCANKFTVSEILYGSPDIHPIPDLANCDHLLLIGSNPRISKSSFVSTPDPVGAMKAIVERGGTVTFVNPLRIEPDIGATVQVAPDSDVWLLAAMLHHIEATVGFDIKRYGDRVHHLEPLREWIADFSPEAVAPVVGVDAATIERLATDFATAERAAIHTSTGVNMGTHGALAYYLAQMLSLVTGNLDRTGGNVTPARAVAPMPATSSPDADSFESTPLGAVRRSKGCLPAGLLPEWIRHPDAPIRAVISLAGNPALSLPGGHDLADALDELDLLVAIDLYRNATAEHADYVLPATDWFERPDLNAFTQGIQTTPHIQFTDAVVEPHAERKPEAEIFSLLSEAMGLEPLIGAGIEGLASVYDHELAAHGLSIAELGGRDRGLALLDGDAAGTLFTQRTLTADGRLDASPALLCDAMARASADLADRLAEPEGQLRLITRRTRNTLNTAMANLKKLKARGAADNPLWMHPDDAAARGLTEGDAADVSNAAGKITAPVAFDDQLRPGVVSMTHGFGFTANPGMPVAQAHPGVNVNELSATGVGSFDPLSGMCHLTGIPVEVTGG